jgi:hypothetical protein
VPNHDGIGPLTFIEGFGQIVTLCGLRQQAARGGSADLPASYGIEPTIAGFFPSQVRLAAAFRNWFGRQELGD